MGKAKKATIEVQGATSITALTQKEDDFMSLMDIERFKDADRSDDLVRNWLSNRNTIEFLDLWEHLNNPSLIPSNSTELNCRLD